MEPTSRRRALAALAGSAALIPAVARAEAKPADDDDIPPTEDLMREHGVIRRTLGVYEELAKRLESPTPPDVHVVQSAAELIRHFAEGYHEKLEEEQVFPRLEKANILVKLCGTLRAQHAAGRAVTAQILAAATSAGWSDPKVRASIIPGMRGFVAMYQPHAAREDTEVFIALRKLVGPKKLDELGDQFEEQEHKLLGQNGFEKALAEVEALEKSLGIDDLARFTVK
ncbi:MAG: hemerythrin domain-containing protein [Deltaproteobacteria bacterium]|nr:hemerythrin domain-containing protein [Deltaproteobacteria bacterium]